MPSSPRIPIPMPEIAAFCKKWKITEFSLFGSVLRDDFGPDSDVDVLVTFDDDAHWRVRHWAQMQTELRQIMGREVDMMTRNALDMMRNPSRRSLIANSTSSIYAR